MKKFASLSFAIFIGIGTQSSFGNPLDQADPTALAPGGSLLATMPPLHFAVEGRLKKNVQFWIRINSEFSTRQGIIHDAKYIDHIYEVIHLSQDFEEPSKIIREAKKKWKRILLNVHQKRNHPETLNEEERKIFDLFQDVHEPNKFLNATHRKRMRYQAGQKERFIDGLHQSGRYLPLMEEAFKQEGIPIELTRLPFVESSFNVRAKSKVGASGIWQFMRSTARLFLRIDDAVDERNDPIRATQAAAKLLKLNFQSLRRWPLAVTAYNYGRKGMMRAVRQIGSEDLEDLVAEYRGRSFGFASSNFYAELLACLELEKNPEKYFGKIERAVPVPMAEVIIPDFIDIRELSSRLKVDLGTLKSINSGLTEAVFKGRLLFPSGYSLRLPVPAGSSIDLIVKEFNRIYSEIPTKFKLRAQRVTKYGTRIKSVKHRFRQSSSSCNFDPPAACGKWRASLVPKLR